MTPAPPLTYHKCLNLCKHPFLCTSDCTSGSTLFVGDVMNTFGKKRWLARSARGAWPDNQPTHALKVDRRLLHHLNAQQFHNLDPNSHTKRLSAIHSPIPSCPFLLRTKAKPLHNFSNILVHQSKSLPFIPAILPTRHIITSKSCAPRLCT